MEAERAEFVNLVNGIRGDERAKLRWNLRRAREFKRIKSLGAVQGEILIRALSCR